MPSNGLHESVMSLSLSNTNLELLNGKPTRNLTIKSRSELSDSSSNITTESTQETPMLSQVSPAASDIFPVNTVKPILRKQKTYAGISFNDVKKAESSKCGDGADPLGHTMQRNATFSGLSHEQGDQWPNPSPIVSFNKPEPTSTDADDITSEKSMASNSSESRKPKSVSDIDVNDQNIRLLHRQATFGGRTANDDVMASAPNQTTAETDKSQLTRAQRRELLRRSTYGGLQLKDRMQQKDAKNTIQLHEHEKDRGTRQQSAYDNVTPVTEVVSLVSRTQTISPSQKSMKLPEVVQPPSIGKRPEVTQPTSTPVDNHPATGTGHVTTQMVEDEAEGTRQRCVPKWDYDTGNLCTIRDKWEYDTGNFCTIRSIG